MTREELVEIRNELSLAIDEILEIRQGKTKNSNAIYPLYRLSVLRENISKKIRDLDKLEVV